MIFVLTKQKEAMTPDADAEAMRRATEDLVNVMSSDPKFRNSNFFQEMAKVASGESVIQENEIVSTGNVVCVHECAERDFVSYHQRRVMASAQWHYTNKYSL